jgi:ribosomal protein S18 acetylase RimI-like enzyme/predicted enzyme related to lactoylglutathione lyase
VPDLEAALAFYRDCLGHELIWRTPTAAGLRLPETDEELVLHTDGRPEETDLKVHSAPEAARRFADAGGSILSGPFEIPIGQCVVVADPWGNRLVLLDLSKGPLQVDSAKKVVPPVVHELEIRTFESEDQRAVWELHNLALEEAGAHGGNGPWDDDVSDPVGFYLIRGGDFVVGVLAGDIVAMGALLPSSSAAAEIKRMRVHPNQQRRGLGTLLLDELERRAQARGFHLLHLDTTTRQVAAQRFYERHGYSVVRRTSRGPFEFIFYEKQIKG